MEIVKSFAMSSFGFSFALRLIALHRRLIKLKFSGVKSSRNISNNQNGANNDKNKSSNL